MIFLNQFVQITLFFLQSENKGAGEGTRKRKVRKD